jgi:hypothetical protein
MTKRSIILPGQKVSGWPKSRKLKELASDKLEKILTTPWREDVHFVQYAVIDEIGAFRYNNEIFKSPEYEEYKKLGGAIELIAVAFDVDSPAKKSGEAGALDIWFEAEREKISRMLRAFPGGLVWRTKGGWRGCWYNKRRIVTPDDAATWRKDYLAAIVYLSREFGIDADSACNDWNRLHRVPWGIRDTEANFGWGEPKAYETIGRLEEDRFLEVSAIAAEADRDEARRRFLSAWRSPPKERTNKQQSARADECDLPTLAGQGVWERVLRSRNLVIRELGPGKLAIQCPNVAHHTTLGNETSTVLYAPGPGEILGHIFCAHHHCAGLDWRALVGVLDDEWAALTREATALLPSVQEGTIVAGQVEEAKETPEEAERRVVSQLIPDATHAHKPAGIPANISHLLTHHPDWKGRLVYDSFKHERYWVSVPDWMYHTHKFDKRVLESDVADIQGWLLRGSGLDKRPPIAASLENVRVGLNNACAKNTFDSLKEHVDAYRGLWDGTPRIDSWLIDYMGADDTLLNRAIGKRWLVASVARALVPGCVADMMPILEGAQEIGKNLLLEIMYGQEFVSIPFGARIGDKDFDQKAADSWCVHDDELACTQRAGLEQVKSWLTQKTAKFRKAWDRDFQTVPRRFIIVGSTNKRNYLTDEENRRFWPIYLRKLKADVLIRDRTQLWSEAVAYFDVGIEYRIMKSDLLWEHLDAEHEERKTTDPVLEKMMHVLDAGLVKVPFTMAMLSEQMGLQLDRTSQLIPRMTIGLRHLGYSCRRMRRPGPDGKSMNAKFWDRGEHSEQNSEHNETTSKTVSN